MATYQQMRDAGRLLTGKLLDATRHSGFNVVRIAKRLTVPVVGRTSVFGDESAQYAFVDFHLQEYRVERKTLVESVDLSLASLTPLDRELIEGMIHSRTSLFEAIGVLSAERQVRFRDLLDPDRPEIHLTDFGLSDTLQRLRGRMVRFSRLITVGDITMSSGFIFAFDPARAPGLVQAYRQKMKRVPPEQLSEHRFIFFFQKYRQYWESAPQQRYADVV